MDELIAVPASAPPPPSMPAARIARSEVPFVFSGDAREYFRIWIVNLALGIVTLGIYSAWAKIRSERYFYGNTRVDGVPFEYLAKPWPILKGRIIALVLFGAYVLAGQIDIKLQLGAAAAIALATPWLIVRGAAFRARYSSWRGLTFRFVPDYAEAYVRYLLLGIPIVLTLGLLYPFVKAKQKAFFVDHHRFGGAWFRLRAKPGQFYPPYLIAWGVTVAWMFAVSMLLGFVFALLLGRNGGIPPAGFVADAVPGLSPQWIPLLMMVPIYGGYFAVWAFLAAALANLVYNHVDLGPHRFRSTLKGSRLLAIYAGNTAAILLSAGLMIPWAKVRLARYRAECMSVLAGGDLADFRAERKTDIGAAAAEMDGLFDIDIGL